MRTSATRGCGLRQLVTSLPHLPCLLLPLCTLRLNYVTSIHDLSLHCLIPEFEQGYRQMPLAHLLGVASGSHGPDAPSLVESRIPLQGACGWMAGGHFRGHFTGDYSVAITTGPTIKSQRFDLLVKSDPLFTL